MVVSGPSPSILVTGAGVKASTRKMALFPASTARLKACSPQVDLQVKSFFAVMVLPALTST